jgi:transcriptional regulator with XRE-family HTH domain
VSASARRRDPVGPLTVPAYLAAVRQLHGLAPGEMARALRVSPSVLRRWQRGTLVPSWRRLRSMTSLWGGDPILLALGAALQRWSRATGEAPEVAARILSSGRRNAPAPPRRRVAVGDRRQLALPIAR